MALRLLSASSQPSRKTLRLTLALLASVLCAQAIQARPAVGSEGSGWYLNIGAGGFYAPDYEGSDRYRFRPLPYVAGGYKGVVDFNGREITVPVLKLGRGIFTAGFSAKMGGGRDESDNRVDLKGLGDIGPAAELGGFARLKFRNFWLGVNAGQDVAGGHKGYVIDSAIGTFLPLTNALSATLSLNTSWVSRKYMDRFFGVTAAQSVASGLPTFSAAGGFKDVGVSAGLNYKVSPSWTASGGVRYAQLLSDAADSPLVRQRGSKDQVASYFFLSYALFP